MSLHHYNEPLVCTYSGGKDSDVMLELFRRSGVPFEVIYSHTTVDAPPTIYHIRDVFKDLEAQGIKCTIEKQKLSMWRLMLHKGIPPTRVIRYCCEYFKERSAAHRFIATGVRWAESNKRKKRQEIEPAKKDNAMKLMLMSDNDRKRQLTEYCAMKAKMIVNPILEWSDNEIWDYYWHECSSHNPLYKMGYYRVGCIGCPMAGKVRYKEFADFPTYERAYIRTFEQMILARHDARKISNFKTGYDYFMWWMEDENIPGQMSIGNYPADAMKEGDSNGRE